ncbi:Heterogeneous nuclear ribonucleoprotein q [Thalictrum thalictroides]|uniref:Heterogeneous nuclear ribonucleoprotein q n=1 Tax=Thalictrum thalictroides TaxID=46969 RepID=A0A7J6W1B1_THATH|nr:Heterogeneous nuclear ribonucleoprotein q [Thalictrum thalictroides]
MPPRRGRKRGSAKKATPSRKLSTSSIEEDNKILPQTETLSNPIEEEIKPKEENAIVVSNVIEVEKNEEDENAELNLSSITKIQEESFVGKEEEEVSASTSTVTTTTVVVEELKESNLSQEKKRLEIEGSNSVKEDVLMDRNDDEEKRLESEGSISVKEDVLMDNNDENVGVGVQDVEELEGKENGESEVVEFEQKGSESTETDSVVVKEEEEVTEEISDEKRLEIEEAIVAEDVLMDKEDENADVEGMDGEKKGESEGGEAEPEEDCEGGETAVGGDVDFNNGVDEDEDSEDEVNESDTDDEDDVDFCSYEQLPPLKDKKKQTEVEIFVGGLNRKAVEEDLITVFRKFGEVKAVRIVKHPVTHRSKGYAFISYATAEQAKKVLTELKDGIEVMGKHAGVSPSQDSDTLYIGNICKTWNKEQVLETLKGFGIEQFEDVYLPDDLKNEGKIRGFAYLEFNTHSDAMSAFQRLRKPDAVFGRNRSAKVAFAPSMHPSEEALSQVKTLYVEGLTDSWSEEKLKQMCEQYGQVEKVQLSRDLVTVKRKDIGFVSFTSRENALACMRAINNSQMGEGDIKVKVELAKPQYKGKLGKKAARGGYMVQKDTEKTEEVGKPKAVDRSISKGAKENKKAPAKQSQSSIVERQGASAAFREREQPSNGWKRDGRSINSGPSGRPSKKPRGNGHGRPTNGYVNQVRNFHSGRGRQPHAYDMARHPRAYDMTRQPHAYDMARQPRAYDMARQPHNYDMAREPHTYDMARQPHTYDMARQPHTYDMAPAVSANPYVQGYTAPGLSYQGRAYGAVSDMEPHAGYLRPSSMNQGWDLYDYGPRSSSGAYYTQGSNSTSYAGGRFAPLCFEQFPFKWSGSGSAGGYVYPSNGAYSHGRPYH